MMQVLVLLERLVLGCTFALSGIAKLVAPSSTREGLVEFGIPSILAGPVGVTLVIAEIASAIFILNPATARFGALTSLILLLVFSIAILLNLARGHRPACNCFGQLHSAPIGWSTLTRNAVLSGIAILVLAHGGQDSPDVGGWIRNLTFAQRAGLLEGLLVLILAAGILALLVQILRQQGRMLLRFDRIDESLEIARP